VASVWREVFRYSGPCCGGCTLNGIRLTTGLPLLRLRQGGRISQDRSCGEVGQCRRNTARLNSNGRMGIWGLTLVRLHQQASEPYLAIAAISRAAGPGASRRIGPTAAPVRRRLTTAYKTDLAAPEIRDEAATARGAPEIESGREGGGDARARFCQFFVNSSIADRHHRPETIWRWRSVFLPSLRDLINRSDSELRVNIVPRHFCGPRQRRLEDTQK